MKNNQEKKTNIFTKVFRFFVPKDFKAEMYKGMAMGNDLKQGKVSPKVVPTWYIGKAIRKIIDPKHKMKIGENKDER